MYETVLPPKERTLAKEANALAISGNLPGISANSPAMEANSPAISANSLTISANSLKISANSLAISANSLRISDTQLENLGKMAYLTKNDLGQLSLHSSDFSELAEFARKNAEIVSEFAEIVSEFAEIAGDYSSDSRPHPSTEVVLAKGDDPRAPLRDLASAHHEDLGHGHAHLSAGGTLCHAGELCHDGGALFDEAHDVELGRIDELGCAVDRGVAAFFALQAEGAEDGPLDVVGQAWLSDSASARTCPRGNPRPSYARRR
jgi:hypothetical protein